MMYYIQEAEWKRIYEFLCFCKWPPKAEAPLRKFIEAIRYIARTGCQWRLLPYYYGNWRAIHKRFLYWARRGIWRELFEYMQIDPDMETAMIDATIVRAHACAAGYGKNSQEQEALGRSRGGFSTKVHALVDGLGNPLRFFLTGGQRHEIIQAEALTSDVQDATVIADKGYDSRP